ncbi:MAG: hydroxymethylglutaryl-CoA lyase [Bernardetiaceae bacterium]|nr:hydroxymethylglutaryl-CoA lyase [Bernardetiaceae bacterium]
MNLLELTECPRDAMQGLPEFIPTDLKARYINLLLKAGFHTIDFGSFVSPHAMPQMRDTAEVLSQLELDNTDSKLLAVVAGYGGAKRAVSHPEIDYLGFPLSISETFQLRNTKKTIAEALTFVADIQALCSMHNKELLVYLSMAFGNPYGEPYNEQIIGNMMRQLESLGIRTVMLSDTIGSAEGAAIELLFSDLIADFPNIKIGAHFHSEAHNALDKIDAAYRSGCRRFDSAMRGLGGCPMAKNKLTGNIATETLLHYLAHRDIESGIDGKIWQEAAELSQEVFAQVQMA